MVPRKEVALSEAELACVVRLLLASRGLSVQRPQCFKCPQYMYVSLENYGKVVK